MSSEQKVGSEQVSGPTGLRERIARHVSGSTHESNYDAVCRKLSRKYGDPQAECPDCKGMGFRIFTAGELAVYSQRIAERAINGADWKTLESERWRLNRDSICGTCRGTGYTRSDGAGTTRKARGDSMFTTVTCEVCRGKSHTERFGRWRGSSCGEIVPPTDKSAEYEDRCPECLGEAFVVPITARPTTKSSEVLSYAEELEDVPIRARLQRESAREASGAAEVLAAVGESDPVTAAAMTALLGPQGDKWAQHQWGRRFALWPLVQAGQQLVQESAAFDSETDMYTRQLEALQTARLEEVQADRGSPRRRALLGLADSQARALEQRVERVIREREAA